VVRKVLLLDLSPLKIGGGFPLNVPLVLWVMTLMLDCGCPSGPAIVVSICSAIVVWIDNWGWTAPAGIVSRGIGIPWWTAASIWGRIGACSVNGWLPWRVVMW